MKKSTANRLLTILIIGLIIAFHLWPVSALAQSASPQASSSGNVNRSVGIDVTNVYDITEQGVIDGDVMNSSDQGIKRSIIDYDPKLFGIYEKNPLVVFRNV